MSTRLNFEKPLVTDYMYKLRVSLNEQTGSSSCRKYHLNIELLDQSRNKITEFKNLNYTPLAVEVANTSFAVREVIAELFPTSQIIEQIGESPIVYLMEEDGISHFYVSNDGNENKKRTRINMNFEFETQITNALHMIADKFSRKMSMDELSQRPPFEPIICYKRKDDSTHSIIVNINTTGNSGATFKFGIVDSGGIDFTHSKNAAWPKEELIKELFDLQELLSSDPYNFEITNYGQTKIFSPDPEVEAFEAITFNAKHGHVLWTTITAAIQSAGCTYVNTSNYKKTDTSLQNMVTVNPDNVANMIEQRIKHLLNTNDVSSDFIKSIIVSSLANK